MRDAAVHRLIAAAAQALTRLCAISVFAAFARPLTALHPPSVESGSSDGPTPALPQGLMHATGLSCPSSAFLGHSD